MTAPFASPLLDPNVVSSTYTPTVDATPPVLMPRSESRPNPAESCVSCSPGTSYT